jgi:1-deoxy-D-xylulose-5-phosphate synthase
MAPKDENELRHMIYTAIEHTGPVAIRYPRGNGLGGPSDPELKAIAIGESEVIKEGEEMVIIALGNCVAPSLEAAVGLEKEGHSVAVINCRFVKPLDRKLAVTAQKVGRVLIVEENIRQGGLGGAFLELLNDMDIENVRIKRIGLPDKFIEHGPAGLLRKNYYLDAEGIMQKARELL